MRLDLVDLEAPLEDQVAAITAACEGNGFFRIPLSSIPVDVANAAWWMAAEFFALSAEEKRQVAFPEPGYPYGYAAFRTETLARSLGDHTALPDLKESLSVGPDCGGPASTIAAGEEWIRSPSRWPVRPAGLQAAWVSYYRALADVAERLMSLMAVALELPADYFSTLIDRPITSMRAIHYPAAGSFDGALRAGAHADYGTLTILRTDGVEGLEIQSGDGVWIPVEPQANTFVVNLGDSIAQWTNNQWRSTVHRVVPNEEARQSFAFFHMANWDAAIECLPTCVVDGEPPKHAPVQAGPWLMRKFQSTVT